MGFTRLRLVPIPVPEDDEELRAEVQAFNVGVGHLTEAEAELCHA